MSTDYYFGLDVGFSITMSDAAKAFGLELEEKSHMEDRYDPKTGKKVDPVKVIDREACAGFAFKGKEYDETEFDELCFAIAHEAGCLAEVSSYQGDWGEAIFGFKHPKHIDEGSDFGRVTTGGGLPLESLVKQIPKYRKLEKALRKLGLKPGKLGIFIGYSVG